MKTVFFKDQTKLDSRCGTFSVVCLTLNFWNHNGKKGKGEIGNNREKDRKTERQKDRKTHLGHEPSA